MLFAVRATQRKKDIATSRAIATFTAMGCDVSIPLTESAAYDLIVDNGDELARVQCKFTSEHDGVEYLITSCLAGRRSVTLREGDALGAVAESGLLQLP